MPPPPAQGLQVSGGGGLMPPGAGGLKPPGGLMPPPRLGPPKKLGEERQPEKSSLRDFCKTKSYLKAFL